MLTRKQMRIYNREWYKTIQKYCDEFNSNPNWKELPDIGKEKYDSFYRFIEKKYTGLLLIENEYVKTYKISVNAEQFLFEAIKLDDVDFVKELVTTPPDESGSF